MTSIRCANSLSEIQAGHVGAVLRGSSVAAARHLWHKEALSRSLVSQVCRASGTGAILAALKIFGQDLQKLADCFLLGTLAKRAI